MPAIIMLFIYIILVIYLYYTRKIIAVRIEEFKRWKHRYYKELEKGTSVFLEDVEEEIVKNLFKK